MADVSFNEPQFTAPTPTSVKQSVFEHAVIAMGLAKDTKSANVVLLSSAVGLIILALGIYILGNSLRTGDGIDPKNLVEVERMQREAREMTPR